MAVKWPGGPSSLKVIKDIQKQATLIQSGVFLAIDPSSKSLGWALYESGVMKETGTITSKKQSIQLRLQDMHQQLRSRFQNIDMLAIEKIRGSSAHDYLKWSIGAIITAVESPNFVEIPTNFWRTIIPEGYVKTDEHDAEMLGNVVIIIAGETLDGEKDR